MNNILLIAKKEFNDALKSKLFLAIFIILAVLSITSILVSSFLFKGQVLDYQNTMQALQASGKIISYSPPEFYPLKLLRGFVDYLEIIGAILGIILGYYSILKEKGKRTMQLLLTRPIKRSEIMGGKILGNTALVSLTLAVLGALSVLILLVVGHATISLAEYGKLAFVVLLSIPYIMIFFCLSAALSLKMKTLSHALIICFALWLVFVLILPQIGDTMDPDNQVPGGFFHSMNFNTTEQNAIMAHFGTYESIRNDIEILSLTKHYERASFSMLGIIPEFNGLSILYILSQKWQNILVVLIFLALTMAADYYIISKKEVFS